MHAERIARSVLRYLLILAFHACPRTFGVIISLGGSTVYQADWLTPVPIGSAISVGYFEPGFMDFSALPGLSWDAVKSSTYREVTTGIINPVAGEWAGGGSVTGIEGVHLYVWVFDSSGFPERIGDGEFGLFTGGSSEWTARGDGLILSPEFNFIGIESVDTAIHGTVTGSNIALAGIPESKQLGLCLGLLAGLLTVFRKQLRSTRIKRGGRFP